LPLIESHFSFSIAFLIESIGQHVINSPLVLQFLWVVFRNKFNPIFTLKHTENIAYNMLITPNQTPRVYGNGQGKYSWWIQFEISNPLEEFPNWFRYRFFYQGINSISIASIYARNI
jgi:hypothetical protein